MLHLDEKQLKALHTRTNLRRLLDYVSNRQVEKISKMCSKGLDPNFHCAETGGEFSACVSEKNALVAAEIVQKLAPDNVAWYFKRVVFAHARDKISAELRERLICLSRSRLCIVI
jgi:hypothetical protein